MADHAATIKYGDVVFLKTSGKGGKYLSVSELVMDSAELNDPRVRALVKMEPTPALVSGASCWRIVSADATVKKGAPVKYGQQIYLRSQYLGASYLSSFLRKTSSWTSVSAVCTAATPHLQGRVTGLLTIVGTADANGPLLAGSAFKLRADSHKTHVQMTDTTEVTQWEIEKAPLHLYTVQLQRGDSGSPWHSRGVFNLDAGLTKLTLDPSTKDDVDLEGSATVGGVARKLVARKGDGNSYRVSYPDAKDKVEQVWSLGGRSEQVVESLSVSAEVDTKPLTGTLQYEDGTSVNVRMSQSGIDTVRYQAFFYPDALNGRTDKLEATIDTTYKLLRDAILELVKQEEFDQAVANLKAFHQGRLNIEQMQQTSGKRETKGEDVPPVAAAALSGTDDAKLTPTQAQGSGPSSPAVQRLAMMASAPPVDTSQQDLQVAQAQAMQQAEDESVDKAFQVDQLLSLYAQSLALNAFYYDVLLPAVTQSQAHHYDNRTPVPVHLYRDCFRMVAREHELIQKIVTQRRWDRDTQNAIRMSEQARELLLMDKLAIRALAPFRHLLPDYDATKPNNPAVITYLSNRTHIHHTPYTSSFVLVGVSYDRLPPIDYLPADADFRANEHGYELLAIPHEVGHFIYERGKLPDGRTIKAACSEFSASPYFKWCEEIFADVYGCVVAGPQAVLGMQAYLMSTDRARGWLDDEHHPKPILRVYILNEMLRLLTAIQPLEKQSQAGRYQFSKIAKRLNEQWSKQLKRWGYEVLPEVDAESGLPRQLYLYDESQPHIDQLVNVARTIEELRPIILEFAYLLLNNVLASDDKEGYLSTAIPWLSEDNESLAFYNKKMAELIKSGLAVQKVAGETRVTAPRLSRSTADFFTDGGKADKTLQAILDESHQDGPTGGGGGLYGG